MLTTDTTPLPGTVAPFYVKGRDGVTRRYHRREWWEGGKRRTAYVRQGDVEATRARCAAWQAKHRNTRASIATASAMLHLPHPDAWTPAVFLRAVTLYARLDELNAERRRG